MKGQPSGSPEVRTVTDCGFDGLDRTVPRPTDGVCGWVAVVVVVAGWVDVSSAPGKSAQVPMVEDVIGPPSGPQICARAAEGEDRAQPSWPVLRPPGRRQGWGVLQALGRVLPALGSCCWRGQCCFQWQRPVGRHLGHVIFRQLVAVIGGIYSQGAFKYMTVGVVGSLPVACS